MVNPKLAKVLWQGSLQDYVRAIAWLPLHSQNTNQNTNSADSPDNPNQSHQQILAAASAAGDVVVWQGQDLILLRSPDRQWISCLEFSADRQFLAAGGQDRQVKIWQVADLNSNSAASSRPNPESTVEFTSESDSESTIMVVKPAYTIDNNTDWIEQLAWSPTADLLAFSQGSKVIIWQVSEQKSIAELDFASSSVFDLAWHPSGEFIAVSGHGGVKVWERQNWQEPIYCLQVPGASLSCSWTDDGAYLASGNLDRTLSVLKWQSPPPWLMQGFPGKVPYLAWSSIASPKNPPILAAACIDGITIWQQQGQTNAAWQSQVLEKHEGFVQAIAFQPQTNNLASAATDGYVYLWQNAQKCQQLYGGIKNGCASLSWDDQGQCLAIGGRSGELIVLSLLNQDRGNRKPKRGFA